MTGVQRFAFWAASKKAITLLVQLEEISGYKCNALVDVRGGGGAHPIRVPVTAFATAPEMADASATLELNLVKSITIVDASGMIGHARHENTFWIGAITAE